MPSLVSFLLAAFANVINHSYIIISSFSHQCSPVISHWILSDIKSLQVSGTLLSILADLNNAVVWMVSIIIIIIIYSFRVFYISASCGFSLEFEWQQVSSSLQD